MPAHRETGMWRCVVVFTLVVMSAAEAGQVRSSFQVGLTITGRVNSAPVGTSIGRASVPLPRPRPAALFTTSGISSPRQGASPATRSGNAVTVHKGKSTLQASGK